MSVKKQVAIWFGAWVLLGATFHAAQGEPTIPGSPVKVFVKDIARPAMLTFDTANDILYIGNDTNFANVKIRSVPLGSADCVAFSEHGNTGFNDPDAVVVDVEGTFTGVAGSVLLGGHNGHISVIFPDGSSDVVFQNDVDGADFRNPADMEFDSDGNLVFVDWTKGAIYRCSDPDDEPTIPPLISLGANSNNLAIASDGRIYVSLPGTGPGNGEIRVYNADGTGQIDFVTGVTASMPEAAFPIAFGPGGAWGEDLYALADGQLLRYDANGVATVVGTGFDGKYFDMAFGPDDMLYISELFVGDSPSNDGRIIRFAPLSFNASNFEPPMGKTKKVGSTLPIKFQLYTADGLPIVSQESLDAVLAASASESDCPHLRIYDVSEFGDLLDLPEDLTDYQVDDLPDNVGGGDCFRFTDEGKCIYNLWLDPHEFDANSAYLVEVVIGSVTVKPGNSFFQTK